MARTKEQPRSQTGSKRPMKVPGTTALKKRLEMEKAKAAAKRKRHHEEEEEKEKEEEKGDVTQSDEEEEEEPTTKKRKSKSGKAVVKEPKPGMKGRHFDFDPETFQRLKQDGTPFKPRRSKYGKAALRKMRKDQRSQYQACTKAGYRRAMWTACTYGADRANQTRAFAKGRSPGADDNVLPNRVEFKGISENAALNSCAAVEDVFVGIVRDAMREVVDNKKKTLSSSAMVNSFMRFLNQAPTSKVKEAAEALLKQASDDDANVFKDTVGIAFHLKNYDLDQSFLFLEPNGPSRAFQRDKRRSGK